MAIKKRRKRRKKKSRISLFLRTFIWAIFVAVFLCCAAGAVYTAHLAGEAEAVSYESIYEHIDKTSFLYDKDGKEIDRLYYTEDREITPVGSIPDVTKNAFIAIEDKTFYKHHGFNFKRLFGAVLSKLLRGIFICPR